MIDLLAATVLAFIVAAAVLTALLRDALAATVVFGVYSLGMAITYALFRAPDVALTEAAVGAGITTSLLLVTVVRTERPTRATAFETGYDPRSLVAILALVGLLLATIPALPAVGDPSASGFERVVPFYLADAPRLGIPNVVTAILVAYRGFDTFGEIVVVVAAGIAVLVALDREGGA